MLSVASVKLLVAQGLLLQVEDCLDQTRMQHPANNHQILFRQDSGEQQLQQEQVVLVYLELVAPVHSVKNHPQLVVYQDLVELLPLQQPPLHLMHLEVDLDKVSHLKNHHKLQLHLKILQMQIINQKQAHLEELVLQPQQLEVAYLVHQVPPQLPSMLQVQDYSELLILTLLVQQEGKHLMHLVASEQVQLTKQQRVQVLVVN